MQTRV